MHSLMHRTNTVLTFFGTVATVLCVLTSVTDVFHKSNPAVKLSLGEVKRLVQHRSSRDQAVITFNLEADLRSAFSWNTKQLFVYVQAEYSTPANSINHVALWDAIIEDKDKAVIKLRNHKTKYSFLDHGKALRGTPFNLTLVWNVMPRVGFLYSESKTFEGGVFPESYKY